MKVFISWSGDRSKSVANALRQWLPMVLQYVDPWISDKDISAGERWAQSIAGELEAANFGIICVTPENIGSEWILFEAGALSKSMLDGKVIPLLFGLELSDLSGPLAQFQAQKVEEAGLMEIIKSINAVAEKPALQQIIDQLVPTLWPQLQDILSNIPALPLNGKHKRPQHEILEELVSGVRGLSARINDADPEFSDRERLYRRRRSRLHPKMIDELMILCEENDDDVLSILMLAGILREDFPWLSEILHEAYRDIRDNGPDAINRSVQRIWPVVKNASRHPIMRDMYGNSKDAMMFAQDLPMIVDTLFSRISKRSMKVRRAKLDVPPD